MKVILTQDIRGKGKRGQMIEVSDGYARNFLFPKKLAQEANSDNVNTMKMNDKARQEREAKERAEAMDISKRMKTFTVTVNAKGGGALDRLVQRAGRAGAARRRRKRGDCRRADQKQNRPRGARGAGRIHRPVL